MATVRQETDVVDSALGGAAKGAATGFLGAALAGATAAGLALTAIVAMVGAVVGTFVPEVGAVSAIVASSGFIGAAAIIGGAISGYTYGTVATAVGAGVGLMRGANRAERDNAVVRGQSKAQASSREAEMAEVHNNAVIMTQQALVPQFEQALAEREQAAEQRGVQKTLLKLQEHAQQEHAKAHTHPEHHEDKGEESKSFVAAHAKTDTAQAASHAAAVLQRRATTAASKEAEL